MEFQSEICFTCLLMGKMSWVVFQGYFGFFFAINKGTIPEQISGNSKIEKIPHCPIVKRDFETNYCMSKKTARNITYSCRGFFFQTCKNAFNFSIPFDMQRIDPFKIIVLLFEKFSNCLFLT